jgi:hypothetical protein
VDSYLRSLFYERVNDIETRGHLRNALGFCREHGSRALQPDFADGLGVSIIYHDILTNILRRFPENQAQSQLSGGAKSPLAAFLPRGLRSLTDAARRLIQGLSPQEACPVCARRDEFTGTVLSQLRDSLKKEDMRRALAGSDGLCIPHLRQALDAIHDPDSVTLLVDTARDRLVSLNGELAEYIRKNDYRFQGEPVGSERDSWKRAVRKLIGER